VENLCFCVVECEGGGGGGGEREVKLTKSSVLSVLKCVGEK
jgi:hypothetical protein